MGNEIFVMGYRLYQRRDGLYEDIRGIKFDYTSGRLFQERSPGQWFWLRGIPEPQEQPESRLTTSGVMEF